MADSKNCSPRNAQDEYLPDAPAAHNGTARFKPVIEGITPQNPSTMPRGEDDDQTRRNSPEFHDRPGGTPPKSSSRS
jgi:hypothetical protein